MRLTRALALAALVPLAALATASATAGANTTPSARSAPAASARASAPKGTLTISDAQFLWTCGFSPYSPTSNFLSVGVIYEPLLFVNTMRSGAVTPWLASAYSWSNGNKTLTFTIRHGISWNDGQPFGAADVVFTFNMLKKYPAVDLNSVWSVLSSVTQHGSDQVVMNFKREAVPYLYYIADEVGIVPAHIWSKVSNPVTYKDANPVGTGPFLMNKCSSQNVEYVANPHYWQPGEPHIAKIEYPAFASNPPANEILSTGAAQWGGQFIPNLKSEYLAKSPDNHYWFPPVVNVSIFINQKDPLLSNLAVRKEIGR